MWIFGKIMGDDISTSMARDLVGVVGKFVGGVGWSSGGDTIGSAIAFYGRGNTIDRGFVFWYIGFVFSQVAERV